MKSNNTTATSATVEDPLAITVANSADTTPTDSPLNPPEKQQKGFFHGFCFMLCILSALYVFLVGLKIMGESFKVLGGCEAGHLFQFASNAIAGLMIGVLSTVLVQSSSTSTSIIVSLVSSDIISVRLAIPMVMGANIGTTVTSTLVACSQMKVKEQFERSFAAATVHDMFNVLSVAVLLPLELIARPLEKLSLAMVGEDLVDAGESWEFPLNKIIKPVSEYFIKSNKSLIKAAAFDKETCTSTETLMKAGIFKGHTSDGVAGFLCLFLSLVLVVFSLLAMVQLLNILVLSAAQSSIKKALNWNGLFNICIGALITFIVQSSSVTTSVLTPLVGVDLITLENMYPMVLGANIGTTGTAFIAAYSTGKKATIQIALCHLFFNIFGILIWYPIAALRRVPIKMAQAMGFVAARLSWFPIVYLLFVFVALPGTLFGLSVSFEGGVIDILLGSVALIVLLVIVGYIIFWWHCQHGKQKTLEWILVHETHRPKVVNDDLASDLGDTNLVSPANLSATYHAV